jgi:hypothetical protein
MFGWQQKSGQEQRTNVDGTLSAAILAAKDAPGPVMCPDRTHVVRSPCLPKHTVCICTSLYL